MKLKDYLNSLVLRRKSSTSSTKSHQKPIIAKTQHDSTASTDCHYDICGYEDIHQPVIVDEQQSRTQLLLARHAELVNTIVGTRSTNETTTTTTTPPCTQCRMSVRHAIPFIPPPPTTIPPPLPPKLTLEQQLAFSNRNYSSTLATCSPRRECQLAHHQHISYPSPLICSQYTAPSPNMISSSSNSLWTTTPSATASLSKKQRSRIRTNPWIGTNRSSIFIDSSNTDQQQTLPSNQPEYEIYDPTYRGLSSGIIHSESFPQAMSNGNIHSMNIPPPPPPPSAVIPAPAPSVILHQSDSGHGFSLSSSRVINSSLSSSSSPTSSSTSSRHATSGDGLRPDDKQQFYRQKKLKKKISSISPPLVSKRNPYFYPNTIASDSGSLTRRKTSPPRILQRRYQRPTNSVKTTSSMKPFNYQSPSSSSRSIDDHFSLEFEEILENQHSYKPIKEKSLSRKSTSPAKSPFILPLEETNMKLSSPPPLLFSPTLAKTNSRAILKHIEEIENEIRMIKNLDLANHSHNDNNQEENDNDDDDDDDYILSPHAYQEEDFDLEDDPVENNELETEENKDGRRSIYEQVDQWVEKCLNTTTTNTSNPSTLLHTECDRLSNTIKDYVGCVCSNDEQPTTTTTTQPMEIMTAFYISSTPTQITRRTSSFHDKLSQLENALPTSQPKSIQECPF